MKYLSIFIILLFSCETVKETWIDPNLQSYYDQFYIEAELRGVTPQRKEIMLYLDDIPQNGLSKDGKDWAKIRISRSFFEKNKDNRHIIECLVFHELGHGILGRNHYDEEIDSLISVYTILGSDTLNVEEMIISVPVSIMHEGGNYNNVEAYYKQNRDYYLKELFR